MLDRKLLNKALRVENKDVIPKFGTENLTAIMEKDTYFMNIDTLMDYEEGKLKDGVALQLLDILDERSLGIADSDGTPAISLMKKGNEIILHNLFTDEDFILDATRAALEEQIIEQLDTANSQIEESQMEAKDDTEDAENVIFKREPNEYTDETDILAVFPDIIEQPGAEGGILTYSHVGQHGYASLEYLEELEDATPEEYEPLKEELEGQGYVLNVLNGLQGDESVNEAYTIDNALAHLDDEIESAKLVLDRIRQRVEYRMKDNVSYLGEDAIERVRKIADKISKDSSALHELVYNNLIG